MKIRERGFTLIEMLIVLSLTAVIIAIAVSGIIFANLQSRDQADKADLVQVDQAAKEYYSEHGTYPYMPCPNGDPGFDNTGSLQNVFPTGSPTDHAITDFNAAVALLQAANQLTNVGYCSNTSATNASTAYFLVLKTNTPQSCTDAQGANIYLLGNGSYVNTAGATIQYYGLASDDGLANLGGAGLICFKDG